MCLTNPCLLFRFFEKKCLSNPVFFFDFYRFWPISCIRRKPDPLHCIFCVSIRISPRLVYYVFPYFIFFYFFSFLPFYSLYLFFAPSSFLFFIFLFTYLFRFYI